MLSLSVIWLTVAVFLATSVDDFVMLVCLLEDRTLRQVEVVSAKLLNTGAVVMTAIALARGVIAIGGGSNRVAALLPLCIGALMLAGSTCARGSTCRECNGGQPIMMVPRGVARGFLVMSAGSFDNLAAYAGLFAGQNATGAASCSLIIVVLTVTLCASAFVTALARRRIPRVKFRLVRLVPWLLILMGMKALFP
jgi:cadmium resistance protein CadD (predicted permease)